MCLSPHEMSTDQIREAIADTERLIKGRDDLERFWAGRLENLRQLLKERAAEELVAALVDSYWYPREDDLIGGWCIMPVDEPPSAGGIQIGGFLGENIAKHICALHNEGRSRADAR